MKNQRKISFVKETYDRLSREEQRYLRNLVHTLLHIQNTGIKPEPELSPKTGMPTEDKNERG
jgi:hypothetical protein